VIINPKIQQTTSIKCNNHFVRFLLCKANKIRGFAGCQKYDFSMGVANRELIILV